MIKKSLRQAANHYIQNNHSGCLQDKKQRRYVIYKVIEDLFYIGNVPETWEDLSPEHFYKLMTLWKKRKSKSSTIMNHMSIIRKFLITLGCETNTITNQALGLKKQLKHRKQSNIDPSIWRKAQNPIARVLLGLQIHFGLTRSEAMRINPSIHVRAEKLWLTREITFNSRDRVIPILTKEQHLLLNQLKGEKNLIELYGYDAVRLAWQQELCQLKLPVQKSYRYFYAQQRYEQLKNNLTHYKLQLLIMDEMAIKSRTTLWGYLNE
jgi:hypothetical protein